MMLCKKSGRTLSFFRRILTRNRTTSVSDYYRRRSLLYVPGSDQKKITKAVSSLDADIVVIDLEDGVAENMKVWAL